MSLLNFQKKQIAIGKILGCEPEIVGGGILGFRFYKGKKTLAFGYVNGPLGFDLDDDGVELDYGDSRLKDTSSAAKQAEYIKSVVTKHGFKLE